MAGLKGSLLFRGLSYGRVPPWLTSDLTLLFHGDAMSPRTCLKDFLKAALDASVSQGFSEG